MIGFNTLSLTFEDWLQGLHRACGRFDAVPPSSDQQFIGQIALHNHGGLEIAHIRTNADRITRQQYHSDIDGDRHCFLVVNRTGHSEVRQDGRSIRLAPGDMAIFDSTRSSEITSDDLIDHVSIHLSRDAVCRHFAANQRLFGKLNLASTSGKLLVSLSSQILSCDGVHTTIEEGCGLQMALIALLLPTLSDS